MTPQGSKYNHATISPSLKDQITNLGTMGSPGYITPRYYIRVMSGPKSSQRLREHKSRREIIISCVSVPSLFKDIMDIVIVVFLAPKEPFETDYHYIHDVLEETRNRDASCNTT